MTAKELHSVAGDVGDADEKFRLELERRERVEQELRESNMRLSDAFVRLRHMQGRIIQNHRLDALQQMIRGLSHDLNNALMPVIGFSEYLLGDKADLNDRDELRACLQDIRDAAREARELIRSLREFYRASGGGEHVPLDINDIVQRSVASTAPFWREEMLGRGVHVRVKPDMGELAPVAGASSELHEVFANLLLNAAEAMRVDGEIGISTRQEGRWIVARVEDHGVGMADDVIARCMEPFFTTKGNERLGLGLSIVHGIVQRHRGFVEIQSEPGRGTEVIVRLPEAAEPVSGAGGVDTRTHPRLAPIRILVVDDDTTSGRFVAMCLGKHGHVVETATCGLDGLAMFRARSFELVITDQSMSDMRGDELAAQVKLEAPKTRILMLSGLGDIMRDEGRNPASVDMVLSKPVSDKELYMAVVEVMGGAVR